MRRFALSKNDDETIGFVIACLFCGAIDLSELRRWATSVVAELEIAEIPPYIFELVDFDASLAKIYQLIGFVADSSLSKAEDSALYGIALQRGRDIFDMPGKARTAQAALDRNPHIRDAFNQLFPFIAI